MDYADPNFVLTTPELVHLAILKDAAEFANVMAVQDSRVPEIVSGGPYSPAPLRSRRGGLALSLSPGYERMPKDKLRILHEIGAEGIKKAILKNQREFVGLIIGHARQGANYFDRFQYAIGEQTRLF